MAIRKELVLGAPVGETRSKHGIGHPTRGKWKSQYAGMSVPRLAQMRVAVCVLRMNLPKRVKKRLPARIRPPWGAAGQPNQG